MNRPGRLILGAILGLAFGILWHELVHVAIYSLHDCGFRAGVTWELVYVRPGADCYASLTEGQVRRLRAAHRSAEAAGYHLLPIYVAIGSLVVADATD